MAQTCRGTCDLSETPGTRTTEAQQKIKDQGVSQIQIQGRSHWVLYDNQAKQQTSRDRTVLYFDRSSQENGHHTLHLQNSHWRIIQTLKLADFWNAKKHNYNYLKPLSWVVVCTVQKLKKNAKMHCCFKQISNWRSEQLFLSLTHWWRRQHPQNSC